MKDKVIFWFGSDFTQFCMSYYFQKKYDCDMYSIVDITDTTKSFFKNQKLVDFKKTWYLHEQYDIQNWLNDIDDAALDNFKFKNTQTISFELTHDQFEYVEEKIKIFGTSISGLSQALKRIPLQTLWRTPVNKTKLLVD